MNRAHYFVFLSGIALAMPSCATISYTGLKPIYPEATPLIEGYRPQTVRSLQPTLEWEPKATKDITYDVIIWEGVKSERGWVWGLPGKEVYYTQGIQNSTHTVGINLEPKTLYYWSVRTRTGEKVSQWSRYDATAPLLGDRSAENVYFRFFTPSQNEKK